MKASMNGYLEVVRTLLEAKADVNDKTKVRNHYDGDYKNNTINYLDADDDDDCYRLNYVNNR